jgi:hypothetical protein
MPKPPSSFDVQTKGQAAFATFFSFDVAPLHKQYLLYLSICFRTILMLRACVERFDMMGERGNILG